MTRSRLPTPLAPWLALVVLVNALASSALTARLEWGRDFPAAVLMSGVGVLGLVALFALHVLLAERARVRRDPLWPYFWLFPVVAVLVHAGTVFLIGNAVAPSALERGALFTGASALLQLFTSAWLSFALWLTLRAWGAPVRAWTRGVLVAFPVVDALVVLGTGLAPFAEGVLDSPGAYAVLYTPVKLLVVIPVLYLVHGALGAPNPRFAGGMVGLATSGVLSAVAAAAWAGTTGEGFAGPDGPTFPGMLATLARTLLVLASVPGVIALVLAPRRNATSAPEPSGTDA